MTVPYAFGSATTSIPLSQLDANFDTPITLGNTAVQLGNTVTTLNNMTLANATVSSGNVTVTSASLSGNLTFTGTGNRITGDFSNATTTSRVSFQSSTTNGATVVQLIPNGTSSSTQFAAYGGSDILNTSVGQLTNNGTEVRVASGIFGTGTYLPMTFFTGGSERMRVDTSGNVGIGTSSPDNKLHVSQASTDFQVRVTGTSAANAGAIRAYNAGGEASIFGTTGSSNSGYGANLGVLGTVTNIPQVFVTNNAERARIDSSGNLLVNQTSQSSSSKLAVAFSDATNQGIGVKNTGGSGGRFVQFLSSGGSEIGSIQQNGASATSYVTSSDYRLKENIQPMTGALAKVAALKPVTYKWKIDGEDGEGFIAHELAEVCPSAVTGEKDAVNEDGSIKPQGIDTSFLVATLTAALQEAHGLIKDLQSRVDALEAK